MVLRLAYATGYQDNLGHTLAAVAWQEGFVGDRIVRINPEDGKLGSYGVISMQLSTAKYLLGGLIIGMH